MNFFPATVYLSILRNRVKYLQNYPKSYLKKLINNKVSIFETKTNKKKTYCVVSIILSIIFSRSVYISGKERAGKIIPNTKKVLYRHQHVFSFSKSFQDGRFNNSERGTKKCSLKFSLERKGVMS